MYDIQRFAAVITVAEHFRPLITFRAFALLWPAGDYEEIKEMLIEAEIIEEFSLRDVFGEVLEVYWGWRE